MLMDIAPPEIFKGANPRLSTIHEVEQILRAECQGDALPLSLAEIGRRMRAKQTRPEVIRAAVQELARHKLVAIGSKGAAWVVVERGVWDQPTEPLA